MSITNGEFILHSNGPTTKTLVVVGVARDVKSSSLIDGMSTSFAYLPLQQNYASQFMSKRRHRSANDAGTARPRRCPDARYVNQCQTPSRNRADARELRGAGPRTAAGPGVGRGRPGPRRSLAGVARDLPCDGLCGDSTQAGARDPSGARGDGFADPDPGPAAGCVAHRHRVSDRSHRRRLGLHGGQRDPHGISLRRGAARSGHVSWRAGDVCRRSAWLPAMHRLGARPPASLSTCSGNRLWALGFRL